MFALRTGVPWHATSTNAPHPVIFFSIYEFIQFHTSHTKHCTALECTIELNMCVDVPMIANTCRHKVFQENTHTLKRDCWDVHNSNIHDKDLHAQIYFMTSLYFIYSNTRILKTFNITHICNMTSRMWVMIWVNDHDEPANEASTWVHRGKTQVGFRV